MKRTGIVLAFFIITTGVIRSQENYKHSLDGIKQVRIEANTVIKLIAGGDNQLVLSKYKGKEDDNYYHDECDSCPHGVSNSNKRKEKAKGLKAIYPGGEDNTGFGVGIEKDGETLRIVDLKSFVHRHGLSFTIPRHIDVYIDCGNLGSAKVEGFSSEIEINTNVGYINLNKVTGPVTAHTNTGSIRVEFSTVNQKSPITISSSTGDVDVSLPNNTRANLELKSTMGTVYTDFDLVIPKKEGLKQVGSVRKIESSLNNGGVKIKLSSSTGDIYLRKSKN